MQNQNYNSLRKLESNINKKLFIYIDSKVDLNNMLGEFNSKLPYFHDNSKIAFNIWLSTDYIYRNGKTFIESFLEEESYTLSSKEKEILTGRAISHVSIFEVLGYQDEYIYIKDILTNTNYSLWEPDLCHVIGVGEIIFSRVGKLLGHYSFIGDINHLPSSARQMFIEEILYDFNDIRRTYPKTHIKEYLKKYSLNIYEIYNEVIMNLINMEEDIDSHVFSELSDFVNYLQRKESNTDIKKHTSNLTNIFEYYLLEEDMVLSDLDQFQMEELFNTAIEDGFIDSKSSFNSYVSTLKKYLLFLNKKDIKYEDAYKEILDISNNRFHYMKRLSNNDSFEINKDMLSLVSLNKSALDLLADFDKFIIYIGEESPTLTKVNKHIKRNDLFNLSKSMYNAYRPLSKAPRQVDYPLINLFYYISLSLKILSMDHDELVLNDRSISYLKLCEEEKYLLLTQYLWGESFIENILKSDNITLYNSKKRGFTKKLASIDINKKFEIKQLNSNFLQYFYDYYIYLQLFGLLEKDLNNYEFTTLTSLGRKIFKYYGEIYYKNGQFKLIELKDYKK